MLTKYLIPLVAIIGFGGGSFFGAKVLKDKCPDCKPKLECPSCPEPLPCNGIDFEKIKGKYITLENHQHLTMSGDSLIVEKLTQAFRKELQSVRAARCK